MSSALTRCSTWPWGEWQANGSSVTANTLSQHPEALKQCPKWWRWSHGVPSEPWSVRSGGLYLGFDWLSRLCWGGKVLSCYQGFFVGHLIWWSTLLMAAPTPSEASRPVWHTLCCKVSAVEDRRHLAKESGLPSSGVLRFWRCSGLSHVRCEGPLVSHDRWLTSGTFRLRR